MDFDLVQSVIGTALKRPVDASWTETFWFLVDNRRDLLPRLIEETIRQQPRPDIWAGDAVSYLNEDELRAITAFALNAWRSEPSNHSAELVLEHAAMQCPQLFRALLPELFEIATTRKRFYHLIRAAWHGARESDCQWMKVLLEQEIELKEAREASLETRDSIAFEWVKQSFEDEKKFELWLLEVGWRKSGESWQSLYCAEHRHLNFPLEYWSQSDRPLWLSYNRHPTWITKGEGTPHRFGGWGTADCGGCGGKLHHLLTLDSVPDFLSISLERLQLEVCLSCLAWEAMPLFYMHNENGVPRALEEKNERQNLSLAHFRKRR